MSAVEPPRDRCRVASLLFRDCPAVVLRRQGGDGDATAGVHGGVSAVLAVPQRSGQCIGDHGGAAAIPLRIGPTRGCTAGGNVEHVQSFRRATVKVRGVDSLPRCYGDQ